MIQGVFAAIILSFIFGFLTGIWFYRKVTIAARREKVQTVMKKLRFWKVSGERKRR